MKNLYIIKLRRKLNLSQAELAEKAGLSIRTVQRIESGVPPIGHTLDALSTALDVTREEFLEGDEQQNVDWRLIKYVNLSSLLFMIVPTGNILIPLALFYWKEEIHQTTKHIVSIQILWTITSGMVIILLAIVKNWLGLDHQIIALTVMLLVAANFYIVIKNTKEIDENQALSIKPVVSFL